MWSMKGKSWRKSTSRAASKPSLLAQSPISLWRKMPWARTPGMSLEFPRPAPLATFSVGAAAPLLLVIVSPLQVLLPIVATGSLVFLALLGMVGAKAGGANVIKPMNRVTFWGALAMALTTGIGALFGKVV